MALTEFEDAFIFWFSRAVIAHEKLAKAAEETLVIDQECNAIEEEPMHSGPPPAIEPLYVPDGVATTNTPTLPTSNIIPFRSSSFVVGPGRE